VTELCAVCGEPVFGKRHRIATYALPHPNRTVHTVHWRCIFSIFRAWLRLKFPNGVQP